MGNNLCEKHGGNVSSDNLFLCDECARSGINKCRCGGHARIFGEALFATIKCESCGECLSGVGWDFCKSIKDKWNSGERGIFP